MRWMFLDGVMNVFRDKNFFYTGSVSTIDSLVRKYDKSLKITPYIKVIGLIVTLFLTVWLSE